MVDLRSWLKKVPKFRSLDISSSSTFSKAHLCSTISSASHSLWHTQTHRGGESNQPTRLSVPAETPARSNNTNEGVSLQGLTKGLSPVYKVWKRLQFNDIFMVTNQLQHKDNLIRIWRSSTQSRPEPKTFLYLKLKDLLSCWFVVSGGFYQLIVLNNSDHNTQSHWKAQFVRKLIFGSRTLTLWDDGRPDPQSKATFWQCLRSGCWRWELCFVEVKMVLMGF